MTETATEATPTPRASAPDNTAADLGPNQREVADLLASVDRASQRRRWPSLALAAVIGGAITWGLLAYSERDDTSTETEREEVAVASAPVEQRDLAEQVEWAGTLGFGNTLAVNGTDGIVTAAATLGTELAQGDVLLEIDNAPMVVFYGDRPMWRPLAEGDEGPDVFQLESNLVALGYDEEHTVDVDETFTASTEAMVERWQEDLSREITGTVDVDDVVIVTGPALVQAVSGVGDVASGSVAELAVVRQTTTVASAEAGTVSNLAPVGTEIEAETVLYRLGDVDVVALPTIEEVSAAQLLADETEAESGVAATQNFVHAPVGWVVDSYLAEEGSVLAGPRPVLTASTSQLQADIVVSVADADEFAVDQSVSVELADETIVDGTVQEIGAVVPGNGDEDPTVTIIVGVTGADQDQALVGPATVLSVGETVEDAVVVPTRSLVSLAEGGFAVEKIDPTGSTTLVGVELGTFDDGVVEILQGDVAPGDEVVVPA